MGKPIRRVQIACLAIAAAPLLVPATAGAQSSAELRIAVPPGLTSGSAIDASVRLAAAEANILSWSISARLEGLEALGSVTAGTDLDALSRGGFAESGILPGGDAFYTVGVLSFIDPVTLPVGVTEVLRVSCRITRKDPGTIRFVPTDGLALPGDDGRTITNQTLLVGGELRALAASPREHRVLGCAGLTLALQSAAAPPPLEVRRDSSLEVAAGLHIASSDHMSPVGFSFGLRHDPAVLSLEAAVLRDDFIAGFVRQDGFARLELSAGGAAIAVLSSPADPVLLQPGGHGVAVASYRFAGSGRAGDELTATVEVAGGLPLGGEPTPVHLQPRDTLPCDLPRLEVPLVIGPDWWIRGDANGDGKADLTDAIVTLQHLFAGGAVECARAMEINLDGRVDISDPITLLAHLFTGAPAPSPPYPSCGTAESTADCARFPCPAA